MENLVAKYLVGEATPDERMEVEAWRSASAENAAAFLDFKKTWQLSKTPEVGAEAMLAAILSSGDERPLYPWVSVFMKYAAILIAVVGSAFLLYQFAGSPDMSNPQIATYGGSTLPDGSTVFLYHDSKLNVAFTDKNREVLLEGRAYFQVKRDEQKPFIVRTKNADVKVLGTSFVVDARGDDNQVFVESGVVLVTDRETDKNVELHKGEMVRLTSGPQLESNQIADINYLAWKDKKISFRKLPMTDVAVVLEDVYGLKVTFSDPALGACTLSADFNNKSKEEVAKLIAQAFGFDYLLNENQLIYSGAPCN